MRDAVVGEKDIFNAARKIRSTEDRAEYLKQVAGDDSVLLRRVMALLEGYEKRERFLESHASSIAASLDLSSIAEHPDTQIGPYRLLHKIGRGGMGVVYEAEESALGRRVALKILPFASLLNETQLERFNTEATAAARLQHSGIVTIYSVGCERGIHFLAMQLIDGPSLAQVIAELRSGGMEQQEPTDPIVAKQADVLTRDEDGGHYRAVARIGREAAEALQYAHDNGVLHRDVKPSNLLLDNTGHVWIADFGLARIEDESQLTRTGDILGTLRYMSPEQATGERVDARSDVYSLGATLYELATLQPVYDSEDKRDTIKQVLAGNPISPHIVDSRIPKPLSCVISKAMAQLDERYPSAQELADDLQRCHDGEPVGAKPPTTLRRVRAWSRRHRLLSAAIIGLLILVLALPFTTRRLLHDSPDDSQTSANPSAHAPSKKVAGGVVFTSPIAYADTAADGGGSNVDSRGRNMHVFPESDFQSLSGPVTITHFAWRPDGARTTPFQGVYTTLTLKFSTTSTVPGNLSMTFADNVGEDEVVVLSATDYAVSSQNVGPAGGPKEFDIIYALETPFTYDPSQGNLLIDQSWTYEGEFSWDNVHEAGEHGQFIGVNDPAGSTASHSFGGFVTQFTVDSKSSTAPKILPVKSLKSTKAGKK